MKPKNPVVAVPAFTHLNSIPLSWLLSNDEWVAPIPDPRTITESTNVEVTESTVIVDPWTVRFPAITTLSLISVWPLFESNTRLPVEVSIVLAELPIRTLFAVRRPVPTDKAFVVGL